jgi:hypothetical protein
LKSHIRQIDQWNRIERPKTDPEIYRKSTFDNCATVTIYGRITSKEKCRVIEYPSVKEKNSILTLLHKKK